MTVPNRILATLPSPPPSSIDEACTVILEGEIW